ncbi:YjjG family noncanonical pyrimidine nucleotidase [Fructobacillus sp. M158]|uniref:YjjG family noncanonical pyrimidine nucleotidase n=1 Tax=Fructobacillus parabroussonetiae TaxID=2713174 RepID=UPI00200A5B97|nr:YjjG family noncanonical pyrimidine nucleotidase [Fructobacillus parabroussonetiae]MCK8617030.1 YjjG family noncanonical pyrimidine nucleotidase [Fructobacillus parabroussonetiae]
MTVKTLIFDLDDTLLDFRGGEIADISYLFTKHAGLTGAKLDQALKTYQEINQTLWHQYEMKAIDRSQIFEERFPKTLAALQLSDKVDATQLEEEYADRRDHNYRVLAGAKELLQSLAERYTILAGTNGQEETQLRRLKETGLMPYFDQVFTSQGLGVAKPDANFFEKILAARQDVVRDETWMIGDGLNSDILGGQNAHIKTIWVNLLNRPLPSDRHPYRVVHSLDELQHLLQ